MKFLYLPLKREPFEVTLSGEKKIEYRRKSIWIESRIINKKYDAIKFTLGYGKEKPWMLVQYLGWEEVKSNTFSFSNGLKVIVNDGDYALKLGNILETGNI